MGVAGRHLRAGQLDQPGSVVEEVERVSGVAAFEHDRRRSQRLQVFRSPPALPEAGDGAAQQHLRLGQVGSDHRRARQEQLSQRRHRLLFQEAGAALRDHDRVHHQVLQPVGRDAPDDLGAGEHPRLDGSRMQVGEYRVDLGSDDVQRQLLDGRHRDRVLSGDRCDRAGAVDAQRRERLEVRLDAGSAARVGAGDGQRNGGCQARRRTR